ncbi:DNA alkylation repair protein [Thiomicrospira microaerophila]|uniref:DNA alkylation repair protein n=1 Tax=Thiomicrospira microaerophila TaxID=406020 RepID=UPI00200C83E4|nr:DNA alkylation repair protein [Thiomicrospira microaerophila]UQB41279.1 DNA alkylation repair protein [Thiomicrospira microaerophila]
MAPKLKDQFNQAWLAGWLNRLHDTFPKIDKQKADQCLQMSELIDQSLLARIQTISQISINLLGSFYKSEQIAQGLVDLAPDFEGLQGLVLTQMVTDLGLADAGLAFRVLGGLTQYSSAEFAIRDWIEREPQLTMNQMQAWSHSENHHLRRLASEGCRPRLPWGKALNQFKQDPTPILPILQNLIHDPSLYVRKSVANNLNDIGKDHPEVLLTFCQAWLGSSKEADWIIKHAIRNFLKQRDARFLALLSLPKTEHIDLVNWHSDAQVKLGEALHYAFELQADKTLGRLRIELQVDYPRPSGAPLRKVFKLAEADYAVAYKKISKHLSFKPLSTRVYYPGQHTLQLVLNGEIKHQAWFEVVA